MEQGYKAPIAKWAESRGLGCSGEECHDLSSSAEVVDADGIEYTVVFIPSKQARIVAPSGAEGIGLTLDEAWHRVSLLVGPHRTGRRVPAQGDWGRGDWLHPPGTIAWAEHVEAWTRYAAKYGKDQSAEKIVERHGFSYKELVMFLGRAPTTWVSL